VNLSLDFSTATDYKNNSQKARVATEAWAALNMYCPVCEYSTLTRYIANKPVADFYCEDCSSDFELKSKSAKPSDTLYNDKIVDGAYSTMLKRIASRNNPGLLYMHYDTERVTNLLFVPRFFFISEIIEMRKPLKESARRAGWTGCNIKLESVPRVGKIEVIRNGIAESVQDVVLQYKKVKSLQVNNINARSWLLNTLLCVDKLSAEFTLDEIYAFEHELAEKYPNNNNIQPKIRQQLQILRNKGLIHFLGNGRYRKI